MKPMKVETCRECGAKREVPVTCADCASMLVSFDLPFRLSCRFGLTGTRICKRFAPSSRVEILKKGDAKIVKEKQ